MARAKPQSFRINIGGSRWRVVWGNPGRGNIGTCDFAGQVLTLSPGLRGKALIETVVHEVLHASFPNMPETMIRAAASAQARLLWRMGWRPTALKEMAPKRQKPTRL